MGLKIVPNIGLEKTNDECNSCRIPLMKDCPPNRDLTFLPKDHLELIELRILGTGVADPEPDPDLHGSVLKLPP